MGGRTRHGIRTMALSIVAIGVMSSACSRSSSRKVIIDADTGVVAGDFQSLADYLASPIVQDLIDIMDAPRGSTPPDVSGEYASSGVVTFASDQGLEGLDAVADFCFGPASNAALDVRIIDASVVAAGARSFIEGSGDLFTVYTAFRSIQTLEDGSTCEIHEVNLISGRILGDGSISELVVGFGITGLVGRCDRLFVGDLQVSDGTADRVGEGCTDDGSVPAEPADPANVAVTVENSLVVDVLVFLGAEVVPVLEVPALSSASFETAPGFRLEFESLQPLGGQDADGEDLFVGEVIVGAFPEDTTNAGDSISYLIENQVGEEIFFAPLVENRTSRDIFSVANIGLDSTDLPGYAEPPASGLDCFCSLPPSVDPFVIGYYSYDVPGVIAAPEANVHFFAVEDESEEVAVFRGPFALEELTGAVTLRVEEGP